MPTTTLTSRQVKVTLPSQVYLDIKAKARSLGLSLAGYLRHLAITEARSHGYPTFEVTPEVEESYRQALLHQDEAEVVEDIDSYFNNL